MKTLSQRTSERMKTWMFRLLPDALHWRLRGHRYVQEFDAMPDELKEEFLAQEGVIAFAVHQLDLPDVLNPYTHAPSALEVGCGFGRVSSALTAAIHKLHVHGIDVSRELIEVASLRSNRRQTYEVCNAKAPGPRERFVLVYSVEFLMHIRDPWPIMRNMVYSSRRYILHCELSDKAREGRRCYAHDYVGIYHEHGIGARIFCPAPFGQNITIAERPQ